MPGAAPSVREDAPWFAKYPPYVPKHLEVPDVRLPTLFEESLARWPERSALVHYGRRWSYRQLGDAIDRVATAFRRDGLGPGARIALQLPNHPVYPMAFFAALKIGATVVQVSPLYLDDDLVRLLNDARPDALVTLDFLYPNYAAHAARAPVPRVYVARMRDYFPALERPFVNFVLRRRGLHPGDPSGGPVRRFADALRTPPEPLPPLAGAPSEEVAVLQYTGGTTGVPKAAELTHRNLVANALQCRAWFAIQPPGTSVVLASIPFFHIYALTVALTYPLSAGATIVLETRPDPDEILRLVARYRPTEFPGVPALYASLIRHPRIQRTRIRSIRVCVSGSAPLPPEVARRFEELTGGYLIEGYGLTEASPVTHANPIQGERRLGSIGLPLPETDQRIVDPETGTRELPVGEVGELAVRGPQVMRGYAGQPAESALVLRDGWLLTGDLARLDADGYAYVVDRKKDLLDVGGLKVVPREVEETLLRHPAVAEAALTGHADPILGEVPVAFVVRRPGSSVAEAELIAFVRQHLAHYKAPRKVYLVETLPKSAVQKVLRRQLREEAERRDPGPLAAATDLGR